MAAARSAPSETAPSAFPHLLGLFLAAYSMMPRDLVALFVTALTSTIMHYRPPVQPRIVSGLTRTLAFLGHAEKVGGIAEAVGQTPFMLFVNLYCRLRDDERAAIAKLLEEVVVELRKPQSPEDARRSITLVD